MIDRIHAAGCRAIIHCHSAVAGLLDTFVELGADGTDPCEPPPLGDIDWAEAKRRVGGRLSLWGNIEYSILSQAPEEGIVQVVRETLANGAPGGGFVLMPCARLYETTLPAKNQAKPVVLSEGSKGCLRSITAYRSKDAEYAPATPDAALQPHQQIQPHQEWSMNTIFIMSDSFRYDNLACYGPTRVRTPRLDGLAREAYVFDNAYLGSFPTIPNRLDIMSGRFSFIDHEWCPLPRETVTLQQVLSASGIVTQMIADNPHLVEMGFNYERGFDGWEWVRGQETDHWKVKPRRVTLHADPRKLRSPDFLVTNFTRNTAWWTGEQDRFVARTMQTACEWLEENQDLDQFFLYIDTFDPHEPWDAPQPYVDLYDPDYRGDEVNYPNYDFWKNYLNEGELNHTRALYMAEASLVDHWIGALLDKVDELGLREDTAVIFASDHGHLFGEHGLVGKSLIDPVSDHYEAVRMYDDIRRTPLMIRLPGQTEGKHISALVQAPDLMPTILELEGLVTTETIGGQSKTQALQCGVFYSEDWRFDPNRIHGASLMPLLRGETKSLRDIAVCSNTLIHHTSILAKCAVVTEDGWCLHHAGTYDTEARDIKMFINKITDVTAARAPIEPALFCLPEDPEEVRDVIHSNFKLANEIHQRYVAWLEDVGTPSEHLAGRRKLSLPKG